MLPDSCLESLIQTASGFARMKSVGINSSFTAVGYLWNIADNLVRKAPDFQNDGANSSSNVDGSAAQDVRVVVKWETRWLLIFRHFRALVTDPRSEVRNCAVKSLHTALHAHGSKLRLSCLEKCLQDVLVNVLVDIQGVYWDAVQMERKGELPDREPSNKDLIIHHSRNTLRKQLDETHVLVLDGFRRFLSTYGGMFSMELFAPAAARLVHKWTEVIQDAEMKEMARAVSATATAVCRMPPSRVQVKETIAQMHLCGQPSVFEFVWRDVWALIQQLLQRPIPEQATVLLSGIAEDCFRLVREGSGPLPPVMQFVPVMMLCMFLTQVGFSQKATQYPESVISENEDRPLTRSVKACVDQYLADNSKLPKEAVGVVRFIASSPPLLWSAEFRAGDDYDQRASSSGATEPIVYCVEDNDQYHPPRLLFRHALVELLSSGDFCMPSTANYDEWDEEDRPARTGPGALDFPHRSGLRGFVNLRLYHPQPEILRALAHLPASDDDALNNLALQYLCCMFLDPNLFFRDANRLALAGRITAIVVTVARRFGVAISKRDSDKVRTDKGLELPFSAPNVANFIGKTLPFVLGVLREAATPGPTQQKRRAAGFWKIAHSASLQVIEDALVGQLIN